MFFCEMDDEVRYGFFIAPRGSCGYNSCEVGNAYASFYLGTYEEIYKLAMDNKSRRYHDNHHAK